MKYILLFLLVIPSVTYGQTLVTDQEVSSNTIMTLSSNQTVTGVKTLSNASNVFYGDGSHLSGVAASSSKFTVTISSGITISTTNSSVVYVATNTTPDVYTFTLPTVSSADIGTYYIFSKTGSGKVIIQAAGTNTISDSSAGGTVYCDLTIETYANVKLMLVSATQWLMLGGDGDWKTN